jgi:hypothetical protein
MNYLLSEKTKKSLDGLIADHVIDLTSPAAGRRAPSAGKASSGSQIKWAKITAVTDANNYTCSIWTSRASYVNGDTAAETGKAVRVPDIIDAMAVNRTFAVEAQSIITGVDYMAIQQLADL